ncbi:16S rRNA (guanine(966)-N(2))-methyltransferase RsmD [Peptococcaceae bacterium 1198_IL3148]
MNLFMKGLLVLRVIAGIAKKTQLKSPKGMNTRPTTDRVKEAVFNILAPVVVESTFLDLFSGTGGMAIEALSRGASQAVLVEKNPKMAAIIRENLNLTKLFPRAEVMVKDIYAAIKALAEHQRKFDIIYIDPPYYEDHYQRVLMEISEYQILNVDGMVVVESSKKMPPADKIATMTVMRRQVYGDTIINFYQSIQQ